MKKMVSLIKNIISSLRMKYKIKTRDINVNLGCGLSVCKGWVNIDGSSIMLIARLPRTIKHLFYELGGAKNSFSFDEYCDILERNNFVFQNLKYGIPYNNESVKYVYSSHFLEHLYLNDARKLFAEIYRVLKPGGAARIVVPDLDHIISLFNEGKTVEALKYFYGEDKVDEFTSHKYNYNFIVLKNELASAGFRFVNKCTFKNGSLPDLEYLDTRQKGSLFVEAVK